MLNISVPLRLVRINRSEPVVMWKNNHDTKQWTENRKTGDIVISNLLKLKSLHNKKWIQIWVTFLQWSYSKYTYLRGKDNIVHLVNNWNRKVLNMKFCPVPDVMHRVIKIYMTTPPTSLSRHTAFVSSHDDIYAISDLQKFMERSEVDKCSSLNERCLFSCDLSVS